MRFLVWTFRLLVFLVLLALAVRNLHPVTLELFADYIWQAPLVVMLLAAFLAGVAATLLGLALVILRQRREILRLSADLHAAQARRQPAEPANPLLPPAA